MNHIDGFIASLVKKSPLTRLNYESRLLSIEGQLGNLTEVTGPELKAYFRSLDALLEKEQIKPATFNSKVSAVRAFYRWAAGANLIKDNPAADNLRHAPNPSANELKILLPMQVDYMLEAAKHHPRDYALLLFLLNTAARRGEVVKVSIPEFMKAVKDKQILLHGKGRNGGKDEYVSFSEPKMIKKIKAYLKSRNDDCPVLFVNRFKTAMTPKSVENIVKKYMRLANAKWHTKCQIDEKMMHPHILRHTAIYEFWRNTKDPKATMNFARHDSFATTLIYMDKTDYEEQSRGVDNLAWNK